MQLRFLSSDFGRVNKLQYRPEHCTNFVDVPTEEEVKESKPENPYKYGAGSGVKSTITSNNECVEVKVKDSWCTHQPKPYGAPNYYGFCPICSAPRPKMEIPALPEKFHVQDTVEKARINQIIDFIKHQSQNKG